jgi:hypothetical protein
VTRTDGFLRLEENMYSVRRGVSEAEILYV